METSKQRLGALWILLFTLMVLASSGCASTTGGSSGTLHTLHKAERQYNQGMLSSAEDSYRKVLQSNPDHHEAWLKLGNIYVRTGQLEAAIIAYENCGKRQTDDIRCWNNLALARVKQGIDALERGQQNFVPGTSEHVRLATFYASLVETLSSN